MLIRLMQAMLYPLLFNQWRGRKVHSLMMYRPDWQQERLALSYMERLVEDPQRLKAYQEASTSPHAETGHCILLSWVPPGKEWLLSLSALQLCLLFLPGSPGLLD